MKAFEQDAAELEQFLDFIEKDMENVRRVIDFCRENGIDADFKVHAKSETADESAENVGVELEQIVKTLVFRAGDDFVAVLCPGDSRVSEERLEAITGSSVSMANPEEVKDATGYIVGGVSPFDLDIKVLMEESLLEHDRVKPASGSRVVGIELAPEELEEAVDASVEKVI